jgi:hypothetical protein
MDSCKIVKDRDAILEEKWKDYDYAVLIHEGKEPIFANEFNNMILRKMEDSPQFLYRTSKNKIYQYVKVGKCINQRSFLTAYSDPTYDFYKDVDESKKTYLEFDTNGKKSLLIDTENVFPLGTNKILITSRDGNKIKGILQ